jgi:uncharacterized protein (DUF1015 family)
MIRIKPFKGIRPVKVLADKVAINPNNLMNEEERKLAAQRNPVSFAHVVKPRIDFPENTPKNSPELFDYAKSYFKKLIFEKALEQDETECFYVYRQMLYGRTQTGVVSCYHIDEYLNGNIKKHEHTRADKESENVQHVLTTGLQSNPIFLAYEPVSEIDTIINQISSNTPDYHFKSDFDVYHTIWVVKEAPLKAYLTRLFNEHVKVSYIADGHHRAASAAAVAKIKKSENKNHTGEEDYNYLLTCLFPANQLKIYDYNRVVKDLNGKTEEEVLKLVEEKFTVEEVTGIQFQLSKFNEFGMYCNGKWKKLTAKENSYAQNPVDILDVSILQNNILSPILNINDPRTDKRIDFVAGTKGLSSLERRVVKGKAAIAFALYPVSMKQLFDIADAGEVMPPKSTWFEPKLLSGLIIYKML